VLTARVRGRAAWRTLYRVIDEVISKVAENLRPRTLEITQDLHRRILSDIPELRGDERIVGLLNASIDENVAAALHLLQHGFSLDHIQTSSATLEVLLARQEYPPRVATGEPAFGVEGWRSGRGDGRAVDHPVRRGRSHRHDV
jgi:hypothetical protein